MSAPAPSPDRPGTAVVPAAVPRDVVPHYAVDLAIGASASITKVAVSTARRGTRVLAPVVRFGLHPPLIPQRHHPARWLTTVSDRGTDQRRRAVHELSRLLDVLVPLLVPELVRRLDLTALVSNYVDLDAIVSRVDLDSAAARLDVDAVAARLDVDAVAGRLDVDAVLDRLDLTAMVRERVDLDLLVSQVDLDAVATRLDVDAVAARLDIETVINRIDLVGLAEDVIEAIDLPEIIRDSTGAVASDAVREVRMQGIAGDEAVGRVIDRLLGRSTRAKVPVETAAGADGAVVQPPLEPRPKI